MKYSVEGVRMKTFLTLVGLGLFSAAVVGCEANARVGDPDNSTSTHTEVKKTTTVTPSGDTVKTETRIER
jgi:hypothetical protein